MKNKINFTFLLLLFCSSGFGQINTFSYKRELSGVNDQWHKIYLPDEIFEKVSSDFRDIRIFGITKDNDTLEAPYILQLVKDKVSEQDVAFKLVNQSKTGKGYYFTFELLTENPINQIDLEFTQQNFDWKLDLEGSQNLQEWFTIIENYRILSIKNELTKFHFTKLSFPDSRYRYFRLFVKTENKPDLITAKIVLNEVVEGNFRNYVFNSKNIVDNRQYKQTIIDVELKAAVPVSKLKLIVNNNFDYFRPISIQYLTDSFKTEQGWKYNYTTLTSGTLNSMENNEFRFNSTILRKLKIIIDNQDNEPLKIDSLVLEGYIHELIARFNTPATYFLTYGNKQSPAPQYDIDRFSDKIPQSLSPLMLGEELLIEQKNLPAAEPLFKNKTWLWGIIVLIILLLGWFSLRMMRQK